MQLVSLLRLAIVLMKIHNLFSRNPGFGQLVPEYTGEVTANNLVVLVMMIERVHIIEIIEIAVVTLGMKK